MRNQLLFFIIFYFSVYTANSQWIQNYNSPENGNDAGTCITTDNQNNVIVAGYSELQTGSSKYSVIKYSPDGVPLWNFLYNDANSNEDKPYGIITDQQNNIYITGYTTEIYSQTNDYCTIKLSPQGRLIWVRKYNGPAGGEDRSYGIMVDQLNNIVITGSSYNGVSSGLDVLTIKYDPNGNVIGTYTYNGSGSGEDRPYGIIVDQLNNIIITGSTYTSTSLSIDYLTLKYTSEGTLIWDRTYDGTGGEDRSYGIVTDQSDNIYITGASTGSGSGFDYVTMGYSSIGNLLFNKRYNGTGNSDDIAHSIAYAINNEITVTGSSRAGSAPGTEDVVTIRYELTGNERWNRRYNGSSNNTDIAYKVVIPQNSNSYVSIIGYTLNFNGKDILILSYSSTGNFTMEFVINGSGNKDDIAYDGISVSNDIVFTGFQTNTNNNTDFVTAMLTNQQLTEVNKDPVHIPSSYKLYQNYPNPFNPETIIKIDIPEESKVTVAIYNVAGEIESVLIDGEMKTGIYEIIFNAENLPSGIYFCSLSGNGFRLTNKLILLK